MLHWGSFYVKLRSVNSCLSDNYLWLTVNRNLILFSCFLKTRRAHFLVVLSASSPAWASSASSLRAWDTDFALVSAPQWRVACKTFALSADRRTATEKVMWKTRWREKEWRKKIKLERKGSEEVEKERTERKEQSFLSVSLLGTVMSVNICWWHIFYHSKSHSFRHFHGSRAATTAKEARCCCKPGKWDNEHVRELAHSGLFKLSPQTVCIKH